jgi:predicted negative regulator of RcsB-dependent stress response
MHDCNTQADLNDAVEDCFAASWKVAEASRNLQRGLSELREMHSQLAKLNMERQKTIEALADALEIARSQLPNSFAEKAATTIDNALRLAGREPKI